VNGRILITGAAGFIGGHACRALLDAGHDVVALDNLDPFYDRAVKLRTIGELARRRRFSFVWGDVRDPAALDRALHGVDAVVHLAARPGVRPSFRERRLYHSVNVAGTEALLAGCRRAGVGGVVYASSSSTYGEQPLAPVRENAGARPISPYGVTKHLGELRTRRYSRLHGFRVAALRLFTVYGPSQRPDLAMHRFTRLIRAGGPIPRYGDGSSERDYTHVEDIVRGVTAAVRWVADGPPAWEAFNLGASVGVRLDYVIELIAAAARMTPRVVSLGRRMGDVTRTCADVSKARRLLGFSPQISVQDGVPAFVDWYKVTHARQH